MNNYNQALQQTETNDPQAPYLSAATELIRENDVYSDAAIEALAGMETQIRYSTSQTDREVMYRLACKMINKMPFHSECKKKWLADLTGAYQRGNSIPVVEVHEQVAGARVKVVDPLMNQPRVELDADNKAVIRTLPQILEGI